MAPYPGDFPGTEPFCIEEVHDERLDKRNGYFHSSGSGTLRRKIF